MAIRLERLGARGAIHDAYACQLGSKPLGPRTARGTKDISGILLCNGIEAGKVMAVIEALPIHLRHWAVWCYGPRGKAFELSAQAGLFGWLEGHVNNAIALNPREYRPATAGKIRDVVAYTIIDYRHKAVAGVDLYPVKEIKKICGIQHANWRRDFEQWWLWSRELADRLDRQSLPSLAGLLSIISEECQDSVEQAVNGQVKGSIAYIQKMTRVDLQRQS